MTKNILIAIGVAGFLSLSHAGSDVLRDQTIEQPQIANSKEKTSQERKEKAYAALKSFGIGAGFYALPVAIVLGQEYLLKKPHLIAAIASGGISAFSTLVSKNILSQYPRFQKIMPYISTAMAAFLGNSFGLWWIGYTKDFGWETKLSAMLGGFAALTHLTFDVVFKAYLHSKYTAKKDPQKEDKESQETQVQVTA